MNDTECLNYKCYYNHDLKCNSLQRVWIATKGECGIYLTEIKGKVKKEEPR